MERNNELSRRTILSTIGTSIAASSGAVASSGGESEEMPDLPKDRRAFATENTVEYEDSATFAQAINEHAGRLLTALHNDGYIDSPSLMPADLQTSSEGLYGIEDEGEYGAWQRERGTQFVVQLPSKAHDVELHVHPDQDRQYGFIDEEIIVDEVRQDGDDFSTESCDICSTYDVCTDTVCDMCQCEACYEYGERVSEEYFCCRTLDGACDDCGYKASEECRSECCEPCDSSKC